MDTENPAPFHKVLETIWSDALSGDLPEGVGKVKSAAEIAEVLKEQQQRRIKWFCQAQLGHVESRVESSIAAGKSNTIVSKKDLTHLGTIRALEKAGYKISHEGPEAWLVSWDLDFTEKKDA